MLLSRKITIGAVNTSIILLLAVLKYIFPAADLTFFVLASFCIAMSVILTDIRGGVLTYFSSLALMSAIFGIFFALPFIVFFGIYPILKALLEKRYKRGISFGLKVLFFTLISALTVYLAEKSAKVIDINLDAVFEKFSLPDSIYDFRFIILIPVIIIFLVLYDLILSSLIDYFTKKVFPNLKN